MPNHAMDEVVAALDTCRALEMPPDRVRDSLGPYQQAFLETSRHPERMNDHDMQMLARNLRNAARIFLLERDCRRGRYAGALGGD